MQTTTAMGRTWDFSHAIGRIAGVGDGFFAPTAVATAPGGILYVLSRGHAGGDLGITVQNQRISKLTIDEELLAEFGQQEFTWPVALAVDSEGRVYCSEENRNFIAFYSPDGERLGQWGEGGSDPGRLDGPSGIAFDGDQNLYVADTGSHRVQKFTRDGEYISGWGRFGTTSGRFNRPWGVTVDAEGSVYVADWGNDRVQKFTADGVHMLTLGNENTSMTGLLRPSDVAVDSDGDIYVVDWGNHRVRIYDPTGAPIASLHGDAREFSKWAKSVVESNPDVVKAFRRVDDMSELYRFNRPTGIAIDEQDRIIVTDTNRGRLHVYKKERDYAEAQFNL